MKKWQNDPGYRTALKLTQLLCEAPEKLPDTTRSANHFTVVGEKPEWSLGRTPVVVIKDHAFYRLPEVSGFKRRGGQSTQGNHAVAKAPEKAAQTGMTVSLSSRANDRFGLSLAAR